ncbi:MAG: transglutaminase-like domain-containing protein [Parvibaculum sp.]
MKSDMTLLKAELCAAGQAPDAGLDIARLALVIAAMDCPEADIKTYQAHLDDLAAASWAALGKAMDAPPETVAGALASLISGRYGYRGDVENYDDMENANLIQVIERRRGLPVALGILYLHAGKALGLDIGGLSFPGHFLLHLQARDRAVILDPFNGGELKSTPDLLALLRQMEGPQARLMPEFYERVTSRDVLMRLQNNILARAMQSQKYDRAREVITRMTWLAPARPGFRFELGRIEILAGHMAAAATAFSDCMEMAAARGEMRMAGLAEEALRRLKTRLN